MGANAEGGVARSCTGMCFMSPLVFSIFHFCLSTDTGAFFGKFRGKSEQTNFYFQFDVGGESKRIVANCLLEFAVGRGPESAPGRGEGSPVAHGDVDRHRMPETITHS